MKKPQIQIDEDVHTRLKQYCASTGKMLTHVASKVLGEFLETEHEEIPSEGSMIVEGEKEKPTTIVSILKGEQ